MGQRLFLTKRYYKSERSPLGSLRNGGTHGRSPCWHGEGREAGRSGRAPATRPGRAEAGRFPRPPRGEPQSLRAPSHSILILSEDASGRSVARTQEGRQWKCGAREDTPAVVKTKSNGGQSRAEMERKGRSEIRGLPYDQVVPGTLSPGLRPHPARHSLALHPELPTSLCFCLVK